MWKKCPSKQTLKLCLPAWAVAGEVAANPCNLGSASCDPLPHVDSTQPFSTGSASGWCTLRQVAVRISTNRKECPHRGENVMRPRERHARPSAGISRIRRNSMLTSVFMPSGQRYRGSEDGQDGRLPDRTTSDATLNVCESPVLQTRSNSFSGYLLVTEICAPSTHLAWARCR